MLKYQQMLLCSKSKEIINKALKIEELIKSRVNAHNFPLDPAQKHYTLKINTIH